MTAPEQFHKIALITGGSSGIGKAIAQELAKRKYQLLLVSNQADELLKSSNEIEKQHGVVCHTLNTDLSEETSVQIISEFCREKGLSVEVLVNNAGILVFSEVADLAEKKLGAVLHLHMVVPVLLCRIFGKEMKRNKSGFILNISSISAVMPTPAYRFMDQQKHL